MINATKRVWGVAGVNTTLKNAGMDKKIARIITGSIAKGSWDIIRDCTKDLNLQCQNLCNSAYAILIYEKLFPVASQLVSEQISIARANIDDAIIYQMSMGKKFEIEESNRRFRFVSETFFDHLPSDAEFLNEVISNQDNNNIEKPKEESIQPIVICSRDPETCECFNCEIDRKYPANKNVSNDYTTEKKKPTPWIWCLTKIVAPIVVLYLIFSIWDQSKSLSNSKTFTNSTSSTRGSYADTSSLGSSTIESTFTSPETVSNSVWKYRYWEVFNKNDSVLYSSYGNKVSDHILGFIKSPSSCNQEAMFITWSTVSANILDAAKNGAVVSLDIDGNRVHMDMTLNRFRRGSDGRYFFSLNSDKVSASVVSTLKKGKNIHVSIGAPATLLNKLDITEDFFSLYGFTAANLKAREYCEVLSVSNDP